MLLNYTTKVEASKTVAEIQAILLAHGARNFSINYDTAGFVESMLFRIPRPEGEIIVKLPVNWEAVLKVLERQRVRAYVDKAQAIRVAWRILKDWVEAQMAILETEMVRLEQIFLPYMMANDKQTFFEVMRENKFLLKSWNDR